MPQDKTYLDEQGNLINPKKVYLDEQGNLVDAPPTAMSALTQPGLPQGEETVENKTSWLTKASRLLGSIGAPGIGAWMGGVIGRPLGPPGVALGAGIGAAAGEATHQIGQQIFDPEGAPQTSAEAAQRISTAGYSGPAQEVGAIRGATKLGQAAKLITPAAEVVQTAAEYSVPLTKAQQNQGTLASMFESVIKKSLGTIGIFRKRLEEPQNAALIRGAEKIAEDISAVGGTRANLGLGIKEGIAASDQAASTLYGEALKTISQEGGQNVPLNLTRLQNAATPLYNELALPSAFSKGLEGVESRNVALKILDSFVNPKEDVALTFEMARRLRTQLFALCNSGELNIGKGALKQFNHALDVEMKRALGEAGNPDLVKLFENASGFYRRTQELLEQSIIKRLVKTDRPEEIGKILLTQGGESTVHALRSLIGVHEMQRVERGLWEELFSKSVQEGIVVGGRLETKFEALGTEMQKAIWRNPEQLNKVRRFVKLVDTTSLPASMAEPVSAQRQSLLAFGQFAAVTALGGSALSTLSGKSDTGDFMLRVGAAATVVVAPTIMARLITRPGAINVLNQALMTPAKSRKGLELGYKLMTLMVAEQLKESHEERKPYKPGR
jgi:hypothetical protein